MKGSSSRLAIIASLIVLVSYIWISIFGLLQTAHASNNSHHMHSDCPYMIGQQSICSMDTFDHLQAWQAFSTVIVPVFEILALAVLLFATAWLWYLSPPGLGLLYTKQTYGLIPAPLYQQLFSKGILNPKAP